MKIPGVLFTLLFSFLQTSAQFEKGKFAAGLNLGFFYDNNEYNNPTNRVFAISGGAHGEYFFHRNLSVVTGFEFEYKNTLSTKTDIDSFNNRYISEVIKKEWEIAPLLGIRKYWFGNDGRFGFFIMPYVLVAVSRTKNHVS